MNHDEKQIILSCANLLESALALSISQTKADEIVRSVAKTLRSV